jgi:pilus assembly protein Flp/PilA
MTASDATELSPAAVATPSARRTRRREERGQGMVEYALILMLVAIVVLVAIQVLGHSTTGLYSNISNGLKTAGG